MTDRITQLCTFRIGGMSFGVPANRVQEMNGVTAHTRVPLVSSVIHGLVNLRGEIVTMIDMRRRLGYPVVDAQDESTSNVVIRVGEHPVSLVVDEIGDVMSVEGSRFEAVPSTLNDKCRAVVDGVYQLDDMLLLSIDVERLLDVNAIVGTPQEVGV